MIFFLPFFNFFLISFHLLLSLSFYVLCLFISFHQHFFMFVLFSLFSPVSYHIHNILFKKLHCCLFALLIITSTAVSCQLLFPLLPAPVRSHQYPVPYYLSFSLFLSILSYSLYIYVLIMSLSFLSLSLSIISLFLSLPLSFYLILFRSLSSASPLQTVTWRLSSLPRVSAS